MPLPTWASSWSPVAYKPCARYVATALRIRGGFAYYRAHKYFLATKAQVEVETVCETFVESYLLCRVGTRAVSVNRLILAAVWLSLWVAAFCPFFRSSLLCNNALHHSFVRRLLDGTIICRW